MKKYLFFFVLCFSLVSCSKKVELYVFNNSEYNRKHETIEICLCQLVKMNPAKIVVVDEAGRQLKTQLLYKGEKTPQSIIFQVDIPAGKEYIYTLKEGRPNIDLPQTYACTIHSRSGGVAWENDKLAFVISPNGIRIFFKDSDKLILDELLAKDGSNFDQFTKSGANWLYPKGEDSTQRAAQMFNWQLLDAGPLRVSFLYNIDSIPYFGKTIQASYQVSLDANSDFSEIKARFSGDTTIVLLKAGFNELDALNLMTVNKAEHFIAYSKSQAAKRLNYGMIFMKTWDNQHQYPHSFNGFFAYRVGEEFHFSFGASSNQQEFNTSMKWNSYLENKRANRFNSLKIRIMEQFLWEIKTCNIDL